MRNVRFTRHASESGTMAERRFSAIVLEQGWHGYTPEVVTGVDYIVETEKGGLKKVQITIGSPDPNATTKRRGYVVAKPTDRIRKDVDVLAIFIDRHWFLIPIAAYKTDGFLQSYNTNTPTFYVNIDRLKPPMSNAHNAWWVFEQRNLNTPTVINKFLKKIKVSA